MTPYGFKLVRKPPRTPYGRCSMRLSRARELENLHWLSAVCDTCQGAGEGLAMISDGAGSPYETIQPCPDCQARGWVPIRDRRAVGAAAHLRMVDRETVARESVLAFLKAEFEGYIKRRQKKLALRRERPFIPPPAIHRKVLGNG